MRELDPPGSERVGAAIRLLGAEGYERSRIQLWIDRIHDEMLASLADLDAPDTVLDVGCGTGRLLRKIGTRWPWAKLFGVDPTEGMIGVARGLAPGMSFHVAPAESIPIADASIALAVSSISLHHWDDPHAGLREVARALRPGGRLCIADLTLPRFVARLVRSGAHTPAALRRLVAEAGLELRDLRVILARLIVVVVAVKPAPPPLRVFHPAPRSR